MINSLYFDTDCLSAFLWVKKENILSSLFSGKIIVPQEVYNELSYSKIDHLKKRLDVLLNSGDAIVRQIMIGTAEYNSYLKMTTNPDKGYNIIGKGEAAVIALASVSGGIVASNNLKDVAAYVADLGLRHIKTGDILVEAFRRSLITEADGNRIWTDMQAKKRRLGPAASFSGYLHANNLP